jgi:hypothetical protein
MLSPYIYQLAEKFLKQNLKASLMEIGSFNGTGIASLCKKFPERMFYSIDPHIEDGYTEHLTYIARGGPINQIAIAFARNTDKLKNLIHFPYTTSEFIEMFFNRLPKIEILIIDGDHSFHGVITDLALACYLADKKEIIVIMDDVNKPMVAEVIKWFKSFHDIDIKQTDCADMIYFKLKL